MPAAKSNEAKDPHPCWQWLAHRPVLAVCITVGADVLNSLSTYVFDSIVMAIFFLAIAMAAFFGYMTAALKHLNGMCHYCIDEVPVDGDGEASRHMRMLRFAHLLRNPLVAFVPVLAGIAYSIVRPETLAFSLLGSLIWWPFMGAQWVAVRRHQRLGPWCPYCRRGGGGGEEEAPKVPDPVPSGTKTSTA